MAEALVSFLLQQLGSVVNLQHLQEEVRMIVGVEEEAQKLTVTLKAIQTVLYDAEKRQIQEELVKIWLEEFKDVAYEMDDVLDEWRTEILRSQIDDEGLNNDDKKKKMKKKVSTYLCSLCSCFNKVVLDHDIGSKIKKIRERLDWIASEKDKYRFTEINRTTLENSGFEEQIKTSSIIDTLEVCGRDVEKGIILSRLLGESSTNKQQENEARHPQIISIIGMGGLGKTTLAQLVYNDDQVQKHFEKTIWVCVSDPFDLPRIAKAIIQEVGESLPASTEWNALHQKLCDTIKGKRFLLVLDDLWIEDQTQWSLLKLSLKYGAKESRVLVTTRNEKVLLTINTTFRYDLGILSDDDCQLLLSRIAFDGREQEEHTEALKKISFEIAKKCKGLPLAAKTLGSLLRLKKTESQWRQVLESEIWDLTQSYLRKALMLSYYHLPSPLKSCFAYCAIFPKDHKIEKDTLIKLWMAQGFCEVSSKSIGDEYFNNLAMRSFFQDFSKDDDGGITSCKMHDLVHDFAQDLAKNDGFVTQNGELNLYCSKSRHLNLIYENEVEAFVFDPSIYKAKNLRTLQVLMKNDMNSSSKDSLSKHLFHHLRSLRVLNLKNIGLASLPTEIDKLIHLRYLDLSNNGNLKELPNSISRLYNLQTLKLEGCSTLWKLPEGMDKMINLRHLEIKKTDGLKYVPEVIGKLTSLRTLSKFIVGGGSGGCKIGQLKGLNCLEGYLEIRGLGRLETVNEASEAELKTKQHVRHLILSFDHKNDDGGVEGELKESVQEIKRMEGVLDILQPHPNLVSLNIEWYLGSKFPSWISINDSTLTRLCNLKLYNCSNVTELPALGKLPSLRFLKIEAANEVTHIGREFYGIGGNIVSATNDGCVINLTSFPKLESFIMVEMQNLEEWDLGAVEEDDNYKVEIMPCATHMELSCKKLKVLPALGKLPSLEELEITTGEVTCIGREFYGIRDSGDGVGCSVKSISFPKLVSLKMHRMEKLEEWDLGVAQEEGNGGDQIMPCLTEIELNCEKLKVLPALGILPSLKYLKIATREVKYIGREFYKIGAAPSALNFSTVPFSKLESLTMTDMKKLEEWDLNAAAAGEDEEGNTKGEIMPCVWYIRLEDCEKLKVLPALGKLPSLVCLHIRTVGEVTQIGREFYGIGGVGTGRRVNLTAFPKLIYLDMRGIEKVEEWDLGVIEEEEGNNEIVIMPRVELLGLYNFSKLKALRVVAKLPSLKFLVLAKMKELEEFKTVEVGGEREEDDSFKSLLNLSVIDCPKLNSLRHHHLPKLDDLFIYKCSSLCQLPRSLPNLTTLQIVSSPSLLQQISDDDELRRIFPNLITLETSHSNSLVPQYNPRLKEIRRSRANEILASAKIQVIRE